MENLESKSILNCRSFNVHRRNLVGSAFSDKLSNNMVNVDRTDRRLPNTVSVMCPRRMPAQIQDSYDTTTP